MQVSKYAVILSPVLNHQLDFLGLGRLKSLIKKNILIRRLAENTFYRNF